MDEKALVTLVAGFVGGFVMTWFRGYSWFGDGVTSAVALAAGTLCAWLLGAHTPLEWTVGIMSHTLTVFGAVHVGGNVAKMRAQTNLPATVIPQFNELSNNGNK